MILRRFALAAVALLVAGTAVVTLSSARQTFDPGEKIGGGGVGDRRVSLPDHRRINFRCAGSGSPTVLLESGFGAGAEAWTRVQSRIAGVTRVCAYDRAGWLQ